MTQPHQISTLLYCFNAADEALLLRRRLEPNRGLWSPPGGKLHAAEGESPHACARREAAEELGLELGPGELWLAGVVSERGAPGQAHWLMFLFEITRRLATAPPPHREGEFAFFAAEKIASLAIPETDREQIWPLFWRNRGGFFAAHCRIHADGRREWAVDEQRII